MKLECIVTDDYALAPISKKKLMAVQQPGNFCEINIDSERQRSPVQLAKYWSELNSLCDNMSEQAITLLLNNIISYISTSGKIGSHYIHSCLKAMYGVGSIALSVNTTEAREYFDFAFLQLEQMRRLLHG